MTARLLETTHLLPCPFMDESERERRVEAARREFVEAGGRIIRERRCRNEAFDRRGEKSSHEFVVEWPEVEP